jgi:polyferredoxin
MQQANEALKKISIQVEQAPASKHLHRWRRLSQYLTLLVFILIPVSGLFRIDPVAGAFVLLDHQVWFSDIFIVMGFWIFIASLLVMMYSLVGAVFCGWMCPQNTVSEWANELTRKLLGRRAKVMDMSGERMRVAERRRSLLNKAILGMALLLAAMFYALIPLLYFYPPQAIWSLITFQEDARLASSLHWIYFVCVAVMLLDIAVIRHLMCKYMCIYRVWQHSFKTSDTLRIQYDANRSDDCANCHFCVDSCFLDLDPRQSDVFDSCVNCGECITACDHLHERSKKLQGSGLLRFAIGDREGKRQRGAVGSFFSRAKAATTFTVLGGILFAIGVVNYQPAWFTVEQSKDDHGRGGLEYRINVAHKLYDPADMQIRIKGLAPNEYSLEHARIHFDSVGRKDVGLRLSKDMSKGLHRFYIEINSTQGWHESFEVRHYASGGKHG